MSTSHRFVTLDAVNKIQYHDLWVAPYVLHPGLSLFYFAKSVERNEIKEKGEKLVRRVLSNPHFYDPSE